MLNVFEDGDGSYNVRYTSRGRSSIGLRTVDIFVVTVLTLHIHGKSTRCEKNIRVSERSGGRNSGSIFTSLMMAYRKTNQIIEINAGTRMVTVLAVRLIILLT